MPATATKKWYRPGLVFKAHEKSQGHQECCRGYKPIYAADGTLIDEIRALWAEFGVYGSEFRYIDPVTEREEIGSEFRGGYFNLDEQADEKGWTDEEKEIVARHMLRLVESGRGQFTLYSRPAAPKPWPTYNETDADQITVIASTAGLVAEALTYERENENRKKVVRALEDALETQTAPDDPDLAAA